ncbi:MAG: hypothetical protein D6732_17590 [Methanobacteriota archaeon]|nr:MAG: hypothetical protein D6732_17590 [Euryarchaeota archaeon]
MSTQKNEIIDVFNRISRHLTQETTLVIIGSGVGIICNQTGRDATKDIDVWMKTSNFDYLDVKQACEKEGIPFDPIEIEEPDKLYLQIVREGICQVGDYDVAESIRLMRIGSLSVIAPPAENIIASKMVRASDTDIQDSIFIYRHFGVSMEDIENAIDTFSDASKAEIARENLVLLRASLGLLNENSNDMRG